jgi:hypothetical protein
MVKARWRAIAKDAAICWRKTSSIPSASALL